MRERKALLFGKPNLEINPDDNKDKPLIDELEVKETGSRFDTRQREEVRGEEPTKPKEVDPLDRVKTTDVPEDKNSGEHQDPEDPNSEIEEEEVNYRLKVNPVELIAKAFKDEGALPEDFEYDGELSYEDLQSKVRDYHTTRVEQELRSSLELELAEQYGGEDVLSTAKRLRYGTTVEDLKQEDYYNILGNATFDPESSNFEDYAREFLTYYYQDKNLGEKESKILIEAELENATLATLEEKKEYFQNKHAELVNANTKREQDAQKAKEKRISDDIARTKELLAKGEIGGTKYTPDQVDLIQKALYEKTEVITDDAGKRHRVTKYQKIAHDISKDPELQLKYVAQLVVGDFQPPSTKEKTSRVKKELNRELNKYLERVPSSSSQNIDNNLGGRERKKLS